MQNNNKRRNIIDKLTNLDRDIKDLSGQLVTQSELAEKLATQHSIDSKMQQITELRVSLAELDRAEMASIQEKIQGTTRFKI